MVISAEGVVLDFVADAELAVELEVEVGVVDFSFEDVVSVGSGVVVFLVLCFSSLESLSDESEELFFLCFSYNITRQWPNKVYLSRRLTEV